jgi:hypothetical protein
MRRNLPNLALLFVLLTLSFATVLPISGQDTSAIITKLEELRGKLQGQKSLQNEIDVVINQIQAGAFDDALDKLQNDVKSSILARTKSPTLLIQLINEIINLIKYFKPHKPPTPNFTISANPTQLGIEQGSSGTSTITVMSIGGFSQQVTLSTTAPPSGITHPLNPTKVTPLPNHSINSTLTITVATYAQPKSYAITVTGTNGTLMHSVMIVFSVIARPETLDFSLSASPNKLSIQKGRSNSTVITVTSLHDFSKPVDLEVPPVGKAINTTLNPTQVIPPANSYAISIFSINVAGNAPTGSLNITITGHSATVTRNITISIDIVAPSIPVSPDFSVNVVPSELTIQQGDSVMATIIVVSLRGFSQSIDITVTPANISGTSLTLNSTQVTPPPYSFAASVMIVSAAKTATPSNYTLKVTGTNGTLTHTAQISLRIAFETIPPRIVSVSRLIEKPSYNETVEVLASVIDETSGVRDVILNYVSNLESVNITMQLSVREDLFIGNIPALTYNTTVIYHIYACDQAGNWAVSNDYSYFVIDPYPPVIGVPRWSPLNPATNDKITINVTVSKPSQASNIDEVDLLYKNETTDNWKSIPMTSTGANYTAVLTNQSDTFVRFYVSALDRAGNVAETPEQEFTIARPAEVPLAWILAIIVIIAAIIGGSAYYSHEAAKKSRIQSKSKHKSTVTSPLLPRFT